MPLHQIKKLIELLEADSQRSTTASEADIQAVRNRIDEIDRGLLELLNERSKSANVIGDIKKQLGLPVYVPKREENVLSQVRESNKGPLPDASVKRLFERIIDETRALERQKYQDESEKN